MSGGGIVAVKQENTVEIGSLGHGSYTIVDSTTFSSSSQQQQQRINTPQEDDELPNLPSTKDYPIFFFVYLKVKMHDAV